MAGRFLLQLRFISSSRAMLHPNTRLASDICEGRWAGHRRGNESRPHPEPCNLSSSKACVAYCGRIGSGVDYPRLNRQKNETPDKVDASNHLATRSDNSGRRELL